MAVTLIGGTAGGTLLTPCFLPSLYPIWFPYPEVRRSTASAIRCTRSSCRKEILPQRNAVFDGPSDTHPRRIEHGLCYRK